MIGDKRTGKAFGAIVRGIIDAGSLICQRIAAHSPLLSAAKDGAQRVIRLARGENTKRSDLDAEHLVEVLCERGVEHLAESEADGLWLIADPSDLRKPYASEMAALMQVRDVDGKLAPGYRTLKERMAVSWIVDRGFDDVAVWRTIWEQRERLVCRVFHTEQLVAYQTREGQWREGDVAAAQQQLCPLARTQTEMVVRRGRQKKKKRQKVTVAIRSCPLRLTYDTAVRREGEGEEVRQCLWLVEVEILRSTLAPCAGYASHPGIPRSLSRGTWRPASSHCKVARPAITQIMTKCQENSLTDKGISAII